MKVSISERQKIKTIGKRIKELRNKASMTQREVSDLMGIEESSYQRVERGATNPTYITLHRISEAIGVHIKSLFEE